MTEIKDVIKSLITLPGLSGYEDPVRSVITDVWKPLVDDLYTGRLGSIHALKKGGGTDPRPRILLAAHMDAIGMMVTGIEGSWLRFTSVGGIDARILPGLEVIVHGQRDLPAVVVQPPAHLLPVDYTSRQAVEIKHLLVDTCLPAAELAGLVHVGDLISFAQEPISLSDDYLAGHTMDNRASVTAVTACLQALKGMQHAWDVWAVATVQEEVTLGGGLTSPFDLQPDIAIAIDVTFGKGPGGPNDYRTFPLGKGPTIAWGPNIHPALFKMLKETAEKLDLPYQTEVMARHSGTDAYAMQIVAAGFPTAVVGIPLRYMHTPVEIISLKDIERAGRLLAAFIAGLQPESLDKIRWDEEE